MRVGLNATCLNDRPSGAKQRFQGIYTSLVRQLPDVEFILYEPAECRVGDWFSGSPNVTPIRTPIPSEGRVGKVVSSLSYWGSELRHKQFDVFECFNEPSVMCPTGRTLTTIHDIRRMHPDWPFVERQLYSWSLRRTFSQVDRVITVSEAMKGEIMGFDPTARVSVIYNGLNPAQFAAVTERDMGDVRRKFGLPSEFLLAIGHFERRKNYLHLIDAIALLRDRGLSFPLVIIGNDSGERRLVQEKVALANLVNEVKVLSGLSDSEVRCIYKLGSMFVFPSLYEGFGIPILEAMAAGVPVVLSDIPVFREITENKGVYFSPDDPEAIADAIEATLGSSSRIETLVAYGRQRVLEFGFERISLKLADLYASSM